MKKVLIVALYRNISRYYRSHLQSLFGESVCFEDYYIENNPEPLDFDGDLYGKCIRVEFCRRLRDEQKFDSLEALKAQIRENIRQTRDYFAAESTRG